MMGILDSGCLGHPGLRVSGASWTRGIRGLDGHPGLRGSGASIMGIQDSGDLGYRCDRDDG